MIYFVPVNLLSELSTDGYSQGNQVKMTFNASSNTFDQSLNKADNVKFNMVQTPFIENSSIMLYTGGLGDTRIQSTNDIQAVALNTLTLQSIQGKIDFKRGLETLLDMDALICLFNLDTIADAP